MPYTADSAGFDGIVSWNKMPNPLLVHGDVSWQGTMAVDQTIIILTITDTSASSFGTRLVPFGTRGFYLELQDTIHSFIHATEERPLNPLVDLTATLVSCVRVRACHQHTHARGFNGGLTVRAVGGGTPGMMKACLSLCHCW